MFEVLISLIFELIFDVDSLKESANVSVTIFIRIKAKSQSSDVRLHVRGSCFKNLAFPCP